MKKEEFLEVLRDELIQRGLAPELAQRHVRSIALTLSPEDIAEIESMQDPEEIAALAEGIMNVKNRSAKKAEQAQPVPEPSAETGENAVPDAETAEEIAPETAEITDDADEEELYDSDDDMKIATGHGPAADTSSPAEYEEAVVEDDEYGHFIDDEPEAEFPTDGRGRTIFWILLICTLPITVTLLALYFGIFAALFALLAAIVIVLVGGMVGGSAVGAAISLTGIIYGITQLITVTSSAPGLYEIGLGLSVGGAALMLGILLYNCTIHAVPWLFRLICSLFRLCTGKLRDLIKKAKEACYRL